jgi:trigger factor
MQVQVTANGLERRMTIALPAERYDREIENRLKSLSRRVRVDGFRAGKVPLKVVERRWGGSVRQEVLNELVQSSYYEAINQHQLRPAGLPRFEVQPEDGAGLTYIATFEVYPEIDLKVPTGLRLERPVTEITEADIDAMVETLRKQRQIWTAVQRAASEGDRVTLDFKGSLDGAAFAGNAAEGYAVVLGSGSLVPGFEDKLVGLAAGYEGGFDVDFPADYRAADLAGKRVHFEVNVREVAEPRLPEVDEEFIRGFGVKEGGLPAFREEVRTTMRREAEQAVKERVKLQVMDALLAANPIQLPKALVDEEIARVEEQIRDAKRAGLGSGETAEVFEERARRRVALGLIIAEIIRKNQFKATPERVRAAVEAVAATYEHPEEVVKWYFSKRERLTNVEALVLEDQTVEWVIQQAQVEEKPTPFQELVAAYRGERPV